MLGEIEYYQSHNNKDRRISCPGQLAYAPIPFMLHDPISLIRQDYYDPSNPNNSNYFFEKVKITKLRDMAHNSSLPRLNAIHNNNDEFGILNLHKFRPVVLISEEIHFWKDEQRDNGKGHIVAPLYTTKDENGYKFSQMFLLNVQAYKYPNLFYLPESNQFNVRESIMRFDRLTVLSSILLEHCPTSLTDDAMYCVTHWLQYLLSGEADEILMNYRDFAIQNINKQSKKSRH
jgi:hypothetical protein